MSLLRVSLAVVLLGAAACTENPAVTLRSPFPQLALELERQEADLEILGTAGEEPVFSDTAVATGDPPMFSFTFAGIQPGTYTFRVTFWAVYEGERFLLGEVEGRPGRAQAA